MNAIVVRYIPELRQEKNYARMDAEFPMTALCQNLPFVTDQGNDALNLVLLLLTLNLPLSFMHILLAPCNSKRCKFGPTTDI